MTDQTTQAVELAGRLEEESLGLQQLAWSRADGGQHLSVASILLDEAAALLRTQAEEIERLNEVGLGRKAALDGAVKACGTWRRQAERLKNALGFFLEDERFQVAVGGNPNAVERMLAEARAALQPTKASGRETGGEI